MRIIWLIFLSLAVIIGVVSWSRKPAHPAPAALAPTADPPAALVSASPTPAAASLPPSSGPTRRPGASSPTPTPGPVADSLVRFALRQLGVPYRWAGTTPEGGFDCSGFLMYAYAHVGVPVPHSTALLIDAGQSVPRAEARPGDLIVFTGTAPTSTTPGHAGIVISGAGELPLRFVHSSSARRESGVKISQVEGSDYERRFMQVRRVLSAAPLSASELDRLARAAPARQRVVAAVAPVEVRPPAVQVADDAEPVRPARLASIARRPPVKVGLSKKTAAKAKAPAKSAVRRAKSAKSSVRHRPKAATRKAAPTPRPKPKARAVSGGKKR